MFRGFFNTTIDAKGRTSLPAKFREVLLEKYGDERFFITNSNPVRQGDEMLSGLVIHPYKEWCSIEERFQTGAGLGLTSAQLNNIKNWALVPAVDCSTDKLGRILVPPHLRKSAGLEREIVFVGGAATKIEIWSLPKWEKVNYHAMMNFPTDTQALAELGL